jgi:hypothetical protein
MHPGDYSCWTKPFVIQYDRDGNEAWSVEVDMRDGGVDVVGLSVDGAGNSHVAFRALNGDFRTWIFKLDPDGEVLWLVPGIEEDFRAKALACDAEGNVFVTGTTLPGGDEPGDYVTVKYRSDGASLWTARYDGPAGGHDEAAAVAWDPAGSIVVAGTSAGEETGEDFVMVKYDLDGREIWVARHAWPGDLRDVARSLTLDDAVNAVVAGSSMDSSGIGLQVVVAYSPAGHEMWTGALDGHGVEDAWCGVAVDSDGDVYVAGTVESDLAVTKYAGPVASVLALAIGPPPEPEIVGDKAILFVGSLPALDRDSLLHAALFRNVAAGDASELLAEAALYIDDGDGVFDEGKDKKAAVGGFGGDQTLSLADMDEVWPEGTSLTFFLVGQIPPGEGALGAAAPRSSPPGLDGGPFLVGSAAALFLLLLSGLARGRRRFPIRRLLAAAGSSAIGILVCLAVSCDGGGGDGGSRSTREIQVQLEELTVDGVAADGVPARAPWKVSL